MPPLKNKWLIVNLVILLVIIIHSMYRDVQLDKLFPTDLRNRIVGARLQKDGKLPYHYHWQVNEGIRYYNPDEYPWIDTAGKLTKVKETAELQKPGINKITASPFFHELLYPICDLPQRTISRIWLWGEYFLLAMMIAMICGLSNDCVKKWIILNVGILFITTEAWKNLIAAGQLYLFLAFLMCCIIFALVRNKKYEIIFAGVCAAILVLIRPIAIIIFVPFLFYYKNYLLFISTAFTSLALYSIFVIVSPKETALYNDYFSGMKMHNQMHLNADPGGPPAHAVTGWLQLNTEGFDLNEIGLLAKSHPIPVYSENGNFFIIYYKLVHKKIPFKLLFFSLTFTIFILSVLFFLKKRYSPAGVPQVLLFACTLYLIVELFTPIYRHQYNTVQWFPLVLLGFLMIPDWKNYLFFALLVGLGLNICNFSWLPMRHTLGEYCWLASLLILAFSQNEIGLDNNRVV